PSFTRSCTRCRASMRSVPILNRTVTCERARTDEERITSTFGMPLSASSMGIVIISSTSAAVIPGPSVWISTFGGANSGKTSTGILRSSWLPKTSKAAASANRRNRNLKLEPTTQRNINLPPDPGRAGRDRTNYNRVARSEAWPGDVPRDALVARAFGAKLADESHRARLRVEVGRLRTVLRTLADVSATQRGFALAPRTRGGRAGPASAGIHDHLVTPLACGRPAECSPRSRRPAAAATRGRRRPEGPPGRALLGA